jgi:hypothetical protein
MKIPAAVLCLGLVLSFSVAAVAQGKKNDAAAPLKVTAGSAEDRAFRALKAETDLEKQAAAGLEFEKDFPKSPYLPNVHGILVGVYLQKNDPKKMIEFGEKALKDNAESIAALLALSRGHALSEERDLAKAKEFARLAVAVLDDLRSKPPQGGLTENQWKSWLKQNDESVSPWVEYVKALTE